MTSSGNERRYNQWKSGVPGLYDWITVENLLWPSLCCRWGSPVKQDMCWVRQQLYFSERTDGSSPNTLVVSVVRVVRQRALKKARHIVESIERSFVKKSKIIIHPGEVNRIRELPQNSNIVATHTNSPDVLIWNVEAQTNRQPALGATPSRPDLILTGHQDIAEFALATCRREPFVLSGGKDKSVVLWSLQDHVSSLAANDRPTDGTTVGARGVFQGHKDTVEDVQFNGSSPQEFCSVGDDSCLILWDARTGYSPAVKVEKAHRADIHSVSWNSYNENLILTGSADSTIRMYDRRNLTSPHSRRVGAPVHIFDEHSAAITCVEWSPAKASLFGSAAEDGVLNIWDHEQASDVVYGTSSESPALLFKHEGHRGKIVDFQWNPASPLTVASVAENGKFTGGGTLQGLVHYVKPGWIVHADLAHVGCFLAQRGEIAVEVEEFKADFAPCTFQNYAFTSSCSN